MFDTTKKLRVTIQSGGPRTALLRWPTDEEWCRRARAQKFIQKQVGRTVQMDTVGEADADLALFTAVLAEGTPADYDEHEVAAFLARLERAAAVNVEPCPGGYEVTVAVPGAETVHVLRGPTMKQQVRHQREASAQVRRGSSIEIRAFLEPAGALYDDLVVRTEGYAGAVPVIHKAAAVVAVLKAVNELADDGDVVPEA